MRVLVAEDETIIRLDLRDLLERAGFEVCAEARDGEEAVELARSEQPDVAIMDVKMPRLDGIEAARRILDERPIPIVMLTAYGQDELVQRAAEAGVFGYLVKPFREQDLLPAIRTARARHEELTALREEAESLAEALAARKAIERAKGLLMEKEGCPSRRRSRGCARQARSRAGRSRSSPRPCSRRSVETLERLEDVEDDADAEQQQSEQQEERVRAGAGRLAARRVPRMSEKPPVGNVPTRNRSAADEVERVPPSDSDDTTGRGSVRPPRRVARRRRSCRRSRRTAWSGDMRSPPGRPRAKCRLLSLAPARRRSPTAAAATAARRGHGGGPPASRRRSSLRPGDARARRPPSRAPRSRASSRSSSLGAALGLARGARPRLRLGRFGSAGAAAARCAPRAGGRTRPSRRRTS